MVRTRVMAALLAALAVLALDAPSALAASRPHGGTATHPHAGAGTPLPHGSAPTPLPHLSGINNTAVAVGSFVVLLALVILVTRLMSRRAGADARARPGRRTTPGASTDGASTAGPSTDELRAQAASALIGTDDAVRTSEQELGFATARCGERAAAPFLAALQSARAELSAAFTLQQLLDDDIGPIETTIRSHLTAITAHCTEASRLLDEQSEAFDQLQDPEVRAPQLVAEVDAHVVQQSARTGRSRRVLDRLAAKYTPDAVSAVATNPHQADDRLDFAADCLARASQELACGRSGQAALLLQAAESGADQATDLLRGVERTEAQLTQAASALPGALREVDAEIAEAAALLAGQPHDDRAPLVTRAQAIADDVRARQAAGPFDALAALRDVQQADAGLDYALASVRVQQARRERARPVLDQAMLVARSSMTAADEFIETRRGGVGATARTRLAEAQRRFRQAIDNAQDDPEAALTEAAQADALGLEARSLAERDVGGRGQPGQPGEFGGLGAGLDGAILGGILIGSPSVGPGSFGGVGTRGRHVVSSDSDRRY
jgi:hypothetical protein